MLYEVITTINYITDHNGFTLYDLYSYDRKHNEQNGERNQDGTDFNFSWNCGAEGDTALRRVQMLRLQMFKNVITSYSIHYTKLYDTQISSRVRGHATIGAFRTS